MAYREDLTLKDLELCRRVLNSVAASTKGGIAPRNGFEIADACLSPMKDVRLRFLEEFHPELSTYHTWGPGYFNWVDDDHNRYHAFGWDLFKGKYAEAHFGFRLWLPQRLPLSCSVRFDAAKMSAKEEERPLKIGSVNERSSRPGSAAPLAGAGLQLLPGRVAGFVNKAAHSMGGLLGLIAVAFQGSRAGSALPECAKLYAGEHK